jgi:putative MATE family efflux protein
MRTIAHRWLQQIRAFVRHWFRRIPPEEMGTGPPVRTLIVMAVPAAASGIFHTVYQLVDGLFISWLGKEQISGVSLVAPALMLVFAVSMPVSMGVSALASRHLGAGRERDAREVINHGLAIALAVGGLLAIAGPPLAPWLVEKLMASGERGPGAALGPAETSVIAASALQYISIVLLGAVAANVGPAADAALRAQGNTLTPMVIFAVGNSLNAVLDWVFIFGLGLGVRGAAIATVLSQYLIMVGLLIALRHRSTALRPGRVPGRRLFGYVSVLGGIYWLGFPASVSMIGMSVAVLFVNRILVGLNPIAVGVYGIGWRLEMFAFVPIFGMFSAVVPMMGYNLGAGLIARCRRILLGACGVASGSMCAVGIVLFAFPRFFLNLFGGDPEVLQLGTNYLRINVTAYPVIGAAIMLSAGFVGLGRAWMSMVCHLWRNLVVRLPVAWLLAGAAGVTGVWWSYPISSAASFILAVILMVALMRRLAAGEAGAEPAEAITDEGAATVEPPEPPPGVLAPGEGTPLRTEEGPTP